MIHYISKLFFFLLATCVALTASTPAVVSLEKRAPPPLVSQINRPNTFFRAITGREVPYISNYPLNGHPTSFLNVPGDFSANGALYVFHELRQAELWGDSHQNVDPSGSKTWYLVEFRYQPAAGLTTRSFLTGSNEWRDFVNACDEGGRCPATYDIIEGPISIYGGARRQAYIDNGNLVYQAAFASQRALGTMIVTRVTRRTVGRDPESWCPQCNIQ